MVLALLLLLASALADDAPRGRPLPPGTPERFVDQRPTPPYARWPEDAPHPFDTLEACQAWYRGLVPAAGRRTIRRFDAVHRHCEAEDGLWWYREDHADLTMDPVVEPLLFGLPGLAWGIQAARRDHPTALETVGPWVGCPGCTAAQRPLSDAADGLRVAAWTAAAAPAVFSRGNGRLTDTIIMAEVVWMDLAVQQTSALRDVRWRPSGPTATVAAVGFGLATLGAVHADDAPAWQVALPYAAAAGLTGTVVALRVRSGRDGPGDLVWGVASGTAMGLLIPFVHASIARVIDPERLAARRARRVSLAPRIGPDSIGLVGSW